MNEAYHERVIYEEKIPARIIILDSDFGLANNQEMFIPSHWHQGLEISLIENAVVSLQIGQEEYIIENDFTCVNSGDVHALKSKEIREDAKCIIILLSYDFMKSYYPKIDEISFDLSLHQNHDNLKSMFYRIKDLYQHQTEFTYLEISSCLLEVYALLLSQYQSEQKTSSKKKSQVREVLSYLHQHYQENITLEQMAEYCHINKEYFSRQFHYYVGSTFRDYLASYRLFKAYPDIISSDLSIQNIAIKHGFVNVKAMIRLFEKTYGVTPLQYRKKMSRN